MHISSVVYKCKILSNTMLSVIINRADDSHARTVTTRPFTHMGTQEHTQMQAKACRHPLTRSPTHPHTQTESHAPSPLMYNGANDDGEKRWWESFAGWITLNRGGYLSVTVHHWVNWHEKIMKNRAMYHLHHSPPASKYHAGWTNSPAGTVGVHLLWKPELDSSQTFQLTLWHTSWHFPGECWGPKWCMTVSVSTPQALEGCSRTPVYTFPLLLFINQCMQPAPFMQVHPRLMLP